MSLFQAGEAGFVRIAFGATDLGDGSEPTDLHKDRFTAFGIGAQQTGLIALHRLAFEGLIDFGVEGAVKFFQHIHPAFGPFCDFIELFFDGGREVVVHDGGELFVEEVGDNHANVGRGELVFLFSYLLDEHFA